MSDLISLMEYQKIVLEMMENDTDKFVKDYYLNIEFRDGKVFSENFDIFFENYSDKRSVFMNTYSALWFLQAYILQIRTGVFNSSSLLKEKVYKLSLKINSNGIDIASKTGFGFSVFTKVDQLLEALEIVNYNFMKFIVEHESISKSEIHEDFKKSLNEILFDLELGLDECRRRIISKNKNFFKSK